MTVCWFALFHEPDERPSCVSEPDMARLRHFIAATPDLRQALIFTPASTSDPYSTTGAAAAWTATLLRRHRIAGSRGGGERSSAGACGARHPGVTERRERNAAGDAGAPLCGSRSDISYFAGEAPCTYLVAYEGEAEDRAVWLAHYIADHPPIMARFPKIRQIEIYTCIDWCGSLPWPRVRHMQRNKVGSTTRPR